MNRISQYLVYPIVWLFSTLSFEVEFRNPDGFVPIIGKPAIIVANHISFYDSFLLRLNPHWTSLSVYFMGVTRFNAWQMRLLHHIGIIPLVYALFGVFVVVPGRGLEKNLEAPRNILAEGNHIFIFPEGSVNITGTLLNPFKKGAATLAVMTSVPVLPIGFKAIHEAGRKKRIIITLGETVIFPVGTDYGEATKKLEDAVRVLLQ